MDRSTATWHAGADGEGHAFLAGSTVTSAVCGAPRHPERFDHPIARRHETCATELERLSQPAPAPMGETETRYAWGDK